MTRIAIIALILIAIGGFLYFKGSNDAETGRALEDATEYRDIRGRIDDAISGDRDVLERLRGHAQ